MASMKLCKPVQEAGHCGAHAPEKKPHFWQRQHHNGDQAMNKHHGHTGYGQALTQCFGHGAKPPAGGFAYDEADEIVVVRVEKKEEHVTVVHMKNKSRAKKSVGNRCSDGDSSDSGSDNEGKRKGC